MLLDEISGPEFVVRNKKALQAHIDGALLGQSPTQQFSYEVMLWRTPLILTTNKWEYDAFDSADVDWIEANSVAIHVDDPVWLLASPPEAAEVPRPMFLPALTGADPATPRLRRRAAGEAGMGASPEHTRQRCS